MSQLRRRSQCHSALQLGITTFGIIGVSPALLCGVYVARSQPVRHPLSQTHVIPATRNSILNLHLAA